MKFKKSINLIIQIIVISLSLYFLYNELNDNQDISKLGIDSFTDLIKLCVDNYLGISIVFLMMVFNWLIEAIKWRFLIKKIEDISILRSFQAVLTGITVSTFTPNRIGEYAGRVFRLNKADRIQAALITVLGNMSQLLTTLLFGSLGFIFFLEYFKYYNDSLILLQQNFILISIILLAISFLSIMLYFNLVNIISKTEKISWIKKIYRYIKVFSLYSNKELFQVLLLSVLRYIIFTSQFFILLNLFGVHITYPNAIVLIMIMLLIVSVVPTIAITELGLRGSIAVFLFSAFSQNVLGILVATVFIWLINLVIPAFIGTIFIFTLKFFRKY
ncbi:MAG: lysylphosphatidylglycerol synthase transmembrane domain-containing protein [Bacteroidota bacterium]|nr:lysylphosphatidylglycerol synthase transmembrane domain-containing protein [Bacteroidota bacterium]